MGVILNYFKGEIMIGILKKVVSALLTKEKVIGYVVGAAIAVGAAAFDLQPAEIRDAICSQYSSAGK